MVGFAGNLSRKDLIFTYVLVHPVQYCHKGNVLNPSPWHFTSLGIVNIMHLCIHTSRKGTIGLKSGYT